MIKRLLSLFIVVLLASGKDDSASDGEVLFTDDEFEVEEEPVKEKEVKEGFRKSKHAFRSFHESAWGAKVAELQNVETDKQFFMEKELQKD